MSFEYDRRVIIYPTYLNSKRTVAEGRRVAKDKACENPTAQEVYDCVVQGLKLSAELEPKCYPREWYNRGRVRVTLKKPDGTPVNPEIPTRQALMTKVAELVPRHPGRSKKAQAAKQAAAAAAAGGSNSSAATGSAIAASAKPSGKSGKKKKK